MAKVSTLLALLTLFFVSSWAALQLDLFYVHDFLHAARIAEMARGLSDGHIPVRWSQNFGYGYGMPLFQFYAPLPFFIGAIAFLSGFSIQLSTQLLFWLANAFTIPGAYLLGKKLFNTQGGLILAAVYTLAPYRAVNLFVRGAVSEAWGMAWLPWILYAGISFIQKQSYKSWLLLTASLSALTLSHNLIAMIFFPLSFLFIAGFEFTQFKKSVELSKQRLLKLVQVGLAYIATIGVTAFYTIPALLEKQFTQVESVIIGGYFDYSLHFVGIRQLFTDHFGYGGSSWDANDDMSFFLGWGTLLGLLVTVVVFTTTLLKRRKTTKAQLIVFLSGLFSLFSLFMTHSKSAFIWQTLPFLEFIQFPWRWLSLASLFLAAAAAGFTTNIKSIRTNYVLVGAIVATSVWVGLGMFKPSAYLEDSKEFYFSESARIRAESSPVLPDYLPETFTITQPVDEGTLVVNHPEIQEYRVITNKVASKVLQVTTTQPATVVLATAAYPGWEVAVNEESVTHQITPEGLIAIPVSSGSSTILTTFRNTRVRAISDAISAFSLVLIGLTTIMHSRKYSHD